MKVTKQETIHHKNHGATLKHKYEKKIVALPLFLGLSFLYILAFLFLFIYLGNALIMMIITLLLITT